MAKLICDRCGEETYWLSELHNTYRSELMENVCEDCLFLCSKPINYYGNKREKDRAKAIKLLKSGKHYKKRAREKYSSLMNAGYTG